jgi:hypothetical protein
MKHSRLFAFALCTLAVFSMVTSFAQEKKRTSPPATAEGTIGEAKVTVAYSAPSADGRKVMGGLVPYGEVWRTGANNATTVELSKALKVEGKELAAGKYELFTIPSENEWVIVFQKATGQWGAYSYNKDNDVLRVNVKPGKTKEFVEQFKIAVEKDGLALSWENTLVKVSLK